MRLSGFATHQRRASLSFSSHPRTTIRFKSLLNISSDTWLKCRKKLMANTTFQQGRKPKNTWLAGKIKCGHCGYALKATHVPNSTGYFRCTKRTENKGCPGCGKIRKEEFEQFIFSAISLRRVAQRQSTVGLNSPSIFICCSFLWVKTELPKATYI